jgi:hypothetical protein
MTGTNGNGNGSNGNARVGTSTVKQGLAQMLKGGVIVSYIMTAAVKTSNDFDGTTVTSSQAHGERNYPWCALAVFC